nr:putative reverse transcriptase domain-containing protein [Tanacetum cinerariifolium]
GGTGGRAGKGGGRTRGRSGDQGDGRIDCQGGQVGGDQGRGQGNDRNQNGDAVNDNIRDDVSRGCTYKEFLACNSKEYDGKGGSIVYTRWIKKMESVQDIRRCMDSQKMKYTTGSFLVRISRGGTLKSTHEVGKPLAGHAAYTDRFHELVRLVPYLVTPEGKMIERYVYGLAPQIRGMVEATEPKTIQKAVQIASTLTDEALRNGSIKKNPEKRGKEGEPSLWSWVSVGVSDDEERECHAAYTDRFHELVRLVPYLVTPEGKRIERNGSIKKNHEKRGNEGEPSKDRNRREDNKRTRTGNAFTTTTNSVKRENINMTRGRAFMLGAEKARQDPNIMMDIESSEVGFSYEIEIASGQLVEIDKVIKGCKLEIEGHVFDINLIPFGSDSFDVLRVLGEKPKEKIRQLMSTKAKEKKQEEIIVVRDFPKTLVRLKLLRTGKALRTSSEVPLKGDVRILIMDEAHKLKYSVHPRDDKMYYDLRDSTGHDTIWVIVDRLNKSAYFLPMPEDFKMDRLARLYLNEIFDRHGTLLDMSTAYHTQTDGQSERTIQTLEDMLSACVLDFKGSWDIYLLLAEFSYNNSYHSSVRCVPFEALYGKKCRSLLCGQRLEMVQLIGLERKPLEFSVGDYVLLIVSLWKGVVRFGKKGKLAPRFVGPFKIIDKVDPVAYHLDFPKELNSVHDTFHMSKLKKCLADPTLQVPLD